MNYYVRSRISLLAVISSVFHASTSVFAQDVTQTVSSGEMYLYEDTYEYGLGSTLQTVVFIAEVNSEQADIGLPGLSRYFDQYNDDEISAALALQLPQSYVQMVQDVPVTVISWGDPELTDSSYDTIDSFFYETPYTDERTVVTTQLTSGDYPDNLVPIGSRYECYSFGSSGATNFEPYDGYFADCSNNEDIFVVAPGTINTNTHTTSIYIQGTRYFESVDDGYTYTYTIRPRETLTSSSGTLETNIISQITNRNDFNRIQLTGIVNGMALFQGVFDGFISDTSVQQSIQSLTVKGYAIGGAPASLLWMAPVRVDVSEELLSSITTSETSSHTFDILTTTTTQGGMAGGQVLIGPRGACTNVGTDGVTNGDNVTGSFAGCQGGVLYTLNVGETNTNIHTTNVTETTVASVTTENWLNTEIYQLSGSPVFIGHIHSAVRDALFDSGDFGRRHADVLGLTSLEVSDRKMNVWIKGRFGRNTADSNSNGPGSHRNTDGVAGGLSLRLADMARIGIAIDQSKTDIKLAGGIEDGQVRLTQLGFAVHLSPDDWQVSLGVSRGWGTVEAMRSSIGLSSRSHSKYGATLWSAHMQAGRQFSLGENSSIQPYVGAEWNRAGLDAFTETGDTALKGEASKKSQIEFSLGLRTESQLSSNSRGAVRIWMEGRGTKIISGRDRERSVAFVSAPTQALRVGSARPVGQYADAQVGILYQSNDGLSIQIGANSWLGRDNGWRLSGGLGLSF